MTSITVRPARRADARRFLALVAGLARYEKLDPPSAGAERRLVRDAFGRRPRIQVLLATDGGRAVGYAILLETYSSFLARPTLWIEDIFIEPGSRRQGAGRRLLSAIARRAKQRGCHRIEGVVLGWNRSAHRFYGETGGAVLDGWWLLRYDRAAIERLAARPAAR